MDVSFVKRIVGRVLAVVDAEGRQASRDERDDVGPDMAADAVRPERVLRRSGVGDESGRYDVGDSSSLSEEDEGTAS